MVHSTVDREKECLKRSVARSLSEEERKKYAPIPVKTGWNRVFFLKSCNENADEKPIISSVFKPFLGRFGGKNGKILYKGVDTPYLFEWKEEDSVHRKGRLICLDHPSVYYSCNLEGEIPEELQLGEKRFKRYRRQIQTIDADEEGERELLFGALIAFLEAEIRGFPETGVTSFGYPKVTAEEYLHPLFDGKGEHPVAGTRQVYVADGIPLSELFFFSKTPSRPIRWDSRIGRVKRKEVMAVALPRLLAYDLDCRLNNLMLQSTHEGDRIIQIDGGACFPHYRGLDCTGHAPHQWEFFPQAHQRIPRSWVPFINSLDSDEMVDALNICGVPFSPDCELILRASLAMLQASLDYSIPLARLAHVQQRTQAGGQVYPADMWTGIHLAAEEAGYVIGKNRAVTEAMKRSLSRAMQFMFRQLYEMFLNGGKG